MGSEATALGTGGRYDPATDTWTAISMLGAPSPRVSHTAVWTGNRCIVWGGGTMPDGPWLDDGAAYDPATDAWSPLTTDGAPHLYDGHTAVWTGSRMIVWGAKAPCDPPVCGVGGLYDPVADSWQPTSLCGAPLGRRYHSAVWSGASMIIWGRGATGGIYTPP